LEIEFSIGKTPATLRRGWFLGGMKIVTCDESVWLQHPLQPTTHFSWRLDQSWECTMAGHLVRVEKSRPLVAAGLRPQSYRVFVDGQLVAGARGL
jgi:predicted secreted protein